MGGEMEDDHEQGHKQIAIGMAQQEGVSALEDDGLILNQAGVQQAEEGSVSAERLPVVGQAIVNKGILLLGMHTPITKPISKAILDSLAVSPVLQKIPL